MKDNINCGEKYQFMIDHSSYTHNLNSCAIKLKKFIFDKTYMEFDGCHSNVKNDGLIIDMKISAENEGIDL